MKAQERKQTMAVGASNFIGLSKHWGLRGLMSLLGFVGFISCASESSDESPQPAETGSAIVFSANRQQLTNVTRAEVSLHDQGIDAFRVWAFKTYDENDILQVFPGYTVNWQENSVSTTTTNSDGWEYVNQQPSGKEEQTIKYWDWDADDYRFFAIAPASAASSIPDMIDEGPVEITIIADATSEEGIESTPYYSHLWYSTGQLPEYIDRQFGRPVKLEFLKPYAEVRYMFVFTSDAVDRTDITARSFAPVDGTKIHQKGTVKITYPLDSDTKETVLTTVDSSADLTSLDLDYYTTPDDANKEHWYTVLPTGSQGDYKLTITIFGSEKAIIVPSQYMQWEPGYAYTYVFKINEIGGISLDTIQVGINRWTEINVIEHPVYNW